ncbi:MAG: archemetzincin, partial [Ignavibacteriae bacterium]
MTPRIDLLPVGAIEDEVLNVLERRLHQVLEWEVRRNAPLPLPAAAFNEARGQYEALQVMRAVTEAAPENASRVLGILEKDLSIPMLTFVFGQAQLRGRIAIMSLARLRQEFYGLPANKTLTEIRAMKEALHELGHTFGLVHCPVPSCLMPLAKAIQHVDRADIGSCV